MLYKKYHRNYVRKFKKGAIVSFDYGEYVVIEEPFIDKDGILIKALNWYNSGVFLFVVFISGRLRNAIQEIS